MLPQTAQLTGLTDKTIFAAMGRHRVASLGVVVAVLAACTASTGHSRDTEDGSPPSAPSPTFDDQQDSSHPAQALGRIGDECSVGGEFGFSDALTICDAGRVRYALPDDVPPAPPGGYSQRPDWYPSLWQIFSNGTGREPDCAPSTVRFTHGIIPVAALAPTDPYGDMIHEHVTPIDHMYIGLQTLYADPAALSDADYVPVSAPGDGTIIQLQNFGGGGGFRVVIDHGCGVYSVYMVLNKLSGVLAQFDGTLAAGETAAVNVAIRAGDEFGRQRDNPLDFNTFDGSTWLRGFINPFSYLSGEAWKPYTSDPLAHFDTPWVVGLEESFQRLAEPRYGKIDYDLAGSAAGNWFLEGTVGYNGASIETYRAATAEIPGGPPPGKRPAYNHLAFAPHQVDPRHWIFSVGWWLDPDGDARQMIIYDNEGAKNPAELTHADGTQVYLLGNWSPVEPPGSPARRDGSKAPWAIGYTIEPNDQPAGIVAVRVNDDETLTIEVLPGATSPNAFTGFTEAQRRYHR